MSVFILVTGSCSELSARAPLGFACAAAPLCDHCLCCVCNLFVTTCQCCGEGRGKGGGWKKKNQGVHNSSKRSHALHCLHSRNPFAAGCFTQERKWGEAQCSVITPQHTVEEAGISNEMIKKKSIYGDLMIWIEEIIGINRDNLILGVDSGRINKIP